MSPPQVRTIPATMQTWRSPPPLSNPRAASGSLLPDSFPTEYPDGFTTFTPPSHHTVPTHLRNRPPSHPSPPTSTTVSSSWRLRRTRRACGGSQPRLDDPSAGRPDWPCSFGSRSGLFAPDRESQELIGFVRCDALIGSLGHQIAMLSPSQEVRLGADGDPAIVTTLRIGHGRRTAYPCRRHLGPVAGTGHRATRCR